TLVGGAGASAGGGGGAGRGRRAPCREPGADAGGQRDRSTREGDPQARGRKIRATRSSALAVALDELVDAREDAAENVHFLVLEPRAAEKASQPWQQTLRMRRIQEAQRGERAAGV